jgi:hypothetical protein
MEESAVEVAIVMLRREGKALSIGNLRKTLGGGSLRDITRLRRKLLRQLEEAFMQTTTDADAPGPPAAVVPDADPAPVVPQPVELPADPAPAAAVPLPLLDQAAQRLEEARARERQFWPQSAATHEEIARAQQEHRRAQGWLDQLERSRSLLVAAIPQAEHTLRLAQGELAAVEQTAKRDLGRAPRQVQLAREDLEQLVRNLTNIAGAAAVPVEIPLP